MNKQELIKKLQQNPGYLKRSQVKLSKQFNAKLEDVKAAYSLVKHGKSLQFEAHDNVNDSLTTDFEQHLKINGIKVEQVSSVKFWQTSKGDQRFSIVTRYDKKTEEEIKKDIEEFAATYSPAVSSIKRKAITKDRVAYEISLPDIHYGKLTELNIKAMEEQFLTVIEDLVSKAAGLNIEKFILPIGNDGMNSEGLRLTTTNGTPQHDSTGWRETFRGYWSLITTAIDFLKHLAPVHVVVVSGNHDYERMFYAGDVIAGWYRNDRNVTVDNSMNSRKYVEYGNNMILFTHGDKEKSSNLPLIMATEQPEMFSRCKVREVHCGHLHKEKVDEYRGIKVRFIPSICALDDWHKMMGYEALRTAQGFIWSYTNGLEGYLQSNIL